MEANLKVIKASKASSSIKAFTIILRLKLKKKAVKLFKSSFTVDLWFFAD